MLKISLNMFCACYTCFANELTVAPAQSEMYNCAQIRSSYS